MVYQPNDKIIDTTTSYSPPISGEAFTSLLSPIVGRIPLMRMPMPPNYGHPPIACASQAESILSRFAPSAEPSDHAARVADIRASKSLLTSLQQGCVRPQQFTSVTSMTSLAPSTSV